METITSRANESIKFARKVSGGDVTDKFFVEGKRLISELLKSPIKTEQVFVSSEFVGKNQSLVGALEHKSGDVFVMSPSLFGAISKTKSPQGVAAVCARPTDGAERFESASVGIAAGVAVLLHKINNPGNLGAILRTAEAAGAAGVIVTNESANPYSPSAVRGSMGSIFRIPVWTGISLEDAVSKSRELGFITIGAEKDAEIDYKQIDWDRKLLVVFGSEAHGFETGTSGLIDERCRIPMEGNIESLNLSVAAGILLYEARQK